MLTLQDAQFERDMILLDNMWNGDGRSVSYLKQQMRDTPNTRNYELNKITAHIAECVNYGYSKYRNLDLDAKNGTITITANGKSVAFKNSDEAIHHIYSII